MARAASTAAHRTRFRAGRGLGKPERPTEKGRLRTRSMQGRKPVQAILRNRSDEPRISPSPIRPNIIFDVEGTLVDCAFHITESWHQTLQDRGYLFSDLLLHKYSGMDSDDMLRILLPDANDDEKAWIKNRQAERYREEFLPKIQAVPGVRSLLKQLHRNGHRIALATACMSDELATYLDLTGAGEFIDIVACGDDGVRGKPHPDLFRLALGRLGARKNATAVGDTPYDAIAASRAGIRTIGTMTGGFSMRELEDAGCYAVIARLPHLLEFAC
jgi:HAD superfamily hydrolase (TIGR01549 family)